MITIVILLVLSLATVAGVAAAVFGRDETREAGIAAAVVFGVITALVFGLQSAKVIGANEVGVPATFGKLGTPLQSGFHLVKPWTEVATLPTRPRTFTTVATVRTSESGSVAVRLSGRWAVKREDAAALYQQVRTGDEARIQDEVIGPNLISAAGAYMGGLTNFDAVSGGKWEANANGIETIAAKYLAKYGITVDTVQVREVNPDDATERAIALFSAQQRATNIALEAQKTASAEATRRQIEADGLKTAAAASASITSEQLANLCLQAAERIMNRNNDKGLPTYTLPCQSSATPIIASSK